jgi:cytochrome P450
MMITLLLTTLTLLLSLRLIKWIRNYITARSFDLPIVLLPVSLNEPLWMLLRPLFAWVPHLPLNLGTWYLYTSMGWPTEDGARSLHLYGENFVLCSPADNILVTCEPAVIDKVWTEPRDVWRMPESQSQLFTFFGQNVSSTAGAEWKRHRKVTVQAFGERTMSQVWSESRRQTRALKATLQEREQALSLGGVRSSFDVLAMQVLGGVLFGQENTSELNEVPAGHTMSLMESMGFILQHILLTVVFNSLRAPSFLLPGVLRKLKTSVKEVRLYMEELVQAHVQADKPSSIDDANARPTSLLQAMVYANEAEKHTDVTTDSKQKQRSHLTASELYGNIFVFHLGGYETTASTLTFALPFLAMHPEIQSWIFDEISQHTKPHPLTTEQDNDGDYSTTYPLLPRTLALMHETLRLASPAPLFIKTPLVPTPINITTPSGLRRVTIAPGTLVGMNQYAAHLSPRWGPDAASFDPRRFIRVDQDTGREKLEVPRLGAESKRPVYAPWMVGPRACPAKKFSQVEFCAIMVELLAEWRVELLRGEGESEVLARERVGKLLREEKYFNVSAHLKRPEAAGVRLVRR